jgi:membrane-associated phospholipid phosphatase
MNWQNGLQRISAVWWGFWGLLAGLAMFGSPFTQASDKWDIAGMGAAGLVAAYIAHRITCWIVAGFFAPRS